MMLTFQLTCISDVCLCTSNSLQDVAMDGGSNLEENSERYCTLSVLSTCCI